MKRILITGITGFVGTNLVAYLHLNKSIKIFGYSRNINQAKANFKAYDIHFMEDLSSEGLDKNHINIIVHLAGIAHDLSGKFGEEQYYEINYRKAVELYDEFLRSNVESFLFISSIKAVVDNSDKIIDEHTIPEPSSNYGVSKKLTEEYILSHLLENKRIFILRPCMIHGPGNKGNLNLLYKFIKSGIPYPFGSFENNRSFLSIENFSFVVERIIEKKLKPDVYLIADNQPISTNNLVKLIGEVINKSPKILRLPKNLVVGMAKLGSMIHAPFNTGVLSKLCDDMIVSNKKLLLNLDTDLPVSIEEGLKKTIESFNE
jgi:nucleoside-diphosphate-sugar epimerase